MSATKYTVEQVAFSVNYQTLMKPVTASCTTHYQCDLYQIPKYGSDVDVLILIA